MSNPSSDQQESDIFNPPDANSNSRNPFYIVQTMVKERCPNWRSYLCVSILFFVNLLNYMDRFTIAGVLKDVQTYFDIDDAQAGVLQTVFICSFMIFAPVFGYLGDRFSRKKILAAGIFVWSGSVLASTFVPKDKFGLFLFLRGVVGIGEASYTTVAPTLIGDLFAHDLRSKMLMAFYFAIPLGSGLGFVVGSNVANALGNWKWGVRVTPFLGCVSLLLIVFLLEEPVRGQADEGTQLQSTSWLHDLKQIVKCRTFVFSTLGFTAVSFVAGSLSWWAPNFVVYSQQMQGIDVSESSISLIFGIITCLAGFIGVTSGAMLSQYWRRTNPRADPLICAIGLMLCVPFLFLTLITVNKILPLAWACIFFGIAPQFMSWSVNADMLLYVIIPPRRATASAFQILVSHLLGDASSPYLIGVVSDALRGNSKTQTSHFYGLQYAMYIPTFVCVIGGFFFLACAWFVEDDRKRAELIIQGRISDFDPVTEATQQSQHQRSSGGVDYLDVSFGNDRDELVSGEHPPATSNIVDGVNNEPPDPMRLL